MYTLPGRPTGIYVHIPFCESLCPYCDFAVFVRKNIPHREYVDALLLELDGRMDAGELDGREVTTIYFGGGTPSLLPPNSLRRLAERLRSLTTTPQEWTLEANPVHVTPEAIDLWNSLGITRVSLGVQSFDTPTLKRLRRSHTGDDARRVISLLLESPIAVSIDLIFAGPQHTLTTWANDLSTLHQLNGLQHLSAYHLTVEPNTRFGQLHKKGKLPLPDDDIATTMLEQLRDTTTALGMTQYEVASYAVDGYRSLHNSNTWGGAEYLGLGVGAHGLLIPPNDTDIQRHANQRPLRPYLQAPLDQRTTEFIDPATFLAERLYTGVRSLVGIDFNALTQQFTNSPAEHLLPIAHKTLNDLVRQGLLNHTNDHYTPTPRGFLFADSAASLLFDRLL